MKTIFLAAICCVFLGCENQQDDEQQLILSGKFVPEDIVYYDAPVMYVKNTTISDTGIINTFLRSKNELGRVVYSATGSFGSNYPSIEFLNNESIKMSLPPTGTVAQFEAEILQTFEKDIVIKRKDSVVIQNPTYPEPVSHCSQILSFAKKYNPRVNMYPNYRVVYPQYLFKEIDGRLAIFSNQAIVNAVQPAGTCFSAGPSSPTGTILKNPYPVNELLAGDTVVYQMHKVLLRRI